MHELNFDRQKPSLLTVSSHIWDCNALSWLHEHTPREQFKWRGGKKVKASLPQCERDIVSNEGGRVRGAGGFTCCQYGKDFEPPALYCKLLCSSSKPCCEQGAANACIIAAVDVRTCVCVCVFKGNLCLPALCELMNLCMCTCDNKFSNIPKSCDIARNY